MTREIQLVSLVYLVCWFVWFDETNQMNQINPRPSACLARLASRSLPLSYEREGSRLRNGPSS